MNVIYSIGHSTYPIHDFLEILDSFNIQLLADIRRYPGSRKYPQYNQDALRKSLEEHGIQYQYIEELGGRRKPKNDSHNTGWKNLSFRGYADYMEMDNFLSGINELEQFGTNFKTVFMCSESLWWRCHRSLVSDYLKLEGWKVWHIMGKEKEIEHPYSSVAQIINDQLSYSLFK